VTNAPRGQRRRQRAFGFDVGIIFVKLNAPALSAQNAGGGMGQLVVHVIAHRQRSVERYTVAGRD
jgi:hypothetical protein